jgi:hypothetical protein
MPWKPSQPGERPTLGYDVIDWMAENLAAPDTGGHYKPYVVTREQAEFLLRFYEIDPAGKRGQGKRKIRQGVLSRPRGWGKSPFLAAIACAEALGPVVPGGWDADGQPVGIPWSEIRTPLVLVAAVSDKQVMRNSWTPILELLEGPVLDNYPGVEPLGGFVNLPRGRIEPMPSSARSIKGARAVFSIMDQTEEWVATNGGLRLAQTLRDNATKIGGSTLESPNAFVPGEGSVAEETAAYWSAIVEGRKVPNTLLYDHREAPGDTDIDDDASLLHGLAVAYGDSADIDECVIHDPPCIRPGWSDLEDRMNAIRAPNGDLQMARGNFLNQITHASDQFIAHYEWNAVYAEKMAREVPEIAPGDTIVLGFDGSRGVKSGVADSTALVGCRVKDGHLFLVDVWEQPEGPKGKGWNPPADQVDAAVAQCFKKYRVVGFYADPARWEGWVSTWEARYGDRLKVGPKAHPIEWWMTGGSVTKAERAFLSFQEAVVQKELSHDGHPILWKHTVQGRRRIDHNHLTVKKDFPKSPRKIDAFIAAVLAWQARNDAVAKGLAISDNRHYVPKAIR